MCCVNCAHAVGSLFDPGMKLEQHVETSQFIKQHFHTLVHEAHLCIFLHMQYIAVHIAHTKSCSDALRWQKV